MIFCMLVSRSTEGKSNSPATRHKRHQNYYHTPTSQHRVRRYNSTSPLPYQIPYNQDDLKDDDQEYFACPQKQLNRTCPAVSGNGKPIHSGPYAAHQSQKSPSQGELFVTRRYVSVHILVLRVIEQKQPRSKTCTLRIIFMFCRPQLECPRHI